MTYAYFYKGLRTIDLRSAGGYAPAYIEDIATPYPSTGTWTCDPLLPVDPPILGQQSNWIPVPAPGSWTTWRGGWCSGDLDWLCEPGRFGGVRGSPVAPGTSIAVLVLDLANAEPHAGDGSAPVPTSAYLIPYSPPRTGYYTYYRAVRFSTCSVKYVGDYAGAKAYVLANPTPVP